MTARREGKPAGRWGVRGKKLDGEASQGHLEQEGDVMFTNRIMVVFALISACGMSLCAQRPVLPKWEVVKDPDGSIRLRVVNTLERPITAVLCFETVTRKVDGKPFRTVYYLYDNQTGWKFSLGVGETYITPDAIGNMEMSPGTSVPNHYYRHSIELVAVATDAPDLRGDPKHSILIKQRRKARFEVLDEYVTLLRRYESADVAFTELLSQLEIVQQRLTARSGGGEEAAEVSSYCKVLVLSIQDLQRRRGGDRIPAEQLTHLLRRAEAARSTAAQAVIP